MAEEIVEVLEDEEELDLLDTVIDVVSIGGGVVAGCGVSYGLNKIIPAGKDILENVMRTVGIAVAGVGTQYIGTKALQDDLSELRMMIHLGASAGSHLFENDKEN